MLPLLYIAEYRIDMYKLFFYIALATVPIVLFALRKTFSYSKKQALFYSVFTLVFGYLSAMITAYLKRVLLLYASKGMHHDKEKLSNYGIPIFLPLFLLLYCVMFKDNFRKISDYMASCVYSVMTFVKVGCVFCGCCYGKPDEHGIWSDMAGYKTFPVQLYDAITSLCIFFICIILVKKIYGKYTGYIYPIGGILFSLTKGFWECFRVHPIVYEQNFLGTGWTMWQYWLLALFIGCVIWLLLIIRGDKKQGLIFRKQN